ncbi:unnamed protein product [Symbiodinium sp. CCMP2592]|nr:unnamed protein product [Symbiodinium sp. CCMP2592]
MSQPESSDQLRDICQAAPLLPWGLDVHVHYEILANYFRARLSAVFPLRRARCRRTHFSSTTWDLRQQKVWLRKRLHASAHWARTVEIRGAFHALRSHCTLTGLLRPLVPSLLTCVLEIRQHLQELRTIKPLLKRSIVSDRSRYLHEIAVSASSSAAKDVIVKLRPLLGPPKKKQRGTLSLPVVELEDGAVAGDHAQATDRWIRHFSQLEDGGPTTPEALLRQCRHRQTAQDLSDLTLDHRIVPSRCLFEDCLRRSPTGKSQGNDCIPADLLHLQASSVSLPLFQIALKASYRLAEPVHWKGGSLFAIWKRKGSMRQCESFRGILVSSAPGKAFHSALRRKAAPFLDSVAGSLQIGGRPGYPVQLANHTVRSFQSFCQNNGLSSAVVFLDLKEAFHRVVRPLLTGGPLDDANVVGILHTLCFPEDAFSRLQDYVRDTPIFADSGADPWLSGALTEVLSDTWFTWERTSSLAAVRGGTRPGDNLADLLFSFLFSEVLARIRKKLKDLDLQCCFAWREDWKASLTKGSDSGLTAQSPADVTWMDDCALLYYSSSASAVLEGTRRVAATMLDECVRAILMPNLGPGKTETVLSLRGKGARSLRIQALAGIGPSLDIPSEMLGPSELWAILHAEETWLRLAEGSVQWLSAIPLEGGSPGSVKLGSSHFSRIGGPRKSNFSMVMFCVPSTKLGRLAPRSPNQLHRILKFVLFANRALLTYAHGHTMRLNAMGEFALKGISQMGLSALSVCGPLRPMEGFVTICATIADAVMLLLLLNTRFSLSLDAEPDRPSEEILGSLEAIFCHAEDGATSYVALLEQIRLAFCTVCLQRTRLRATAAAWHACLQDLLSQDEEWPVQWASWHTKVARFLLSIDLVEWLVPHLVAPAASISTFRDASTVLPWLDFHHAVLPSWSGARIEISLVFTDRVELSLLLPEVPHRTYSACIADPSLLDFGQLCQCTAEAVVVCDVRHILPSLQPPSPLRSFSCLEAKLHRLRLFSDLVRGVLHLWTHGAGAVLLVSGFDCPTLGALTSLAPHSSSRANGLFLANCPLSSAPPALFTL